MESTTAISYKPLKEKFYSKGFNFTLVKREKNKAIYKKYASKKNFCYEVIKISRHNGYTLQDVYVEPAETYPGDKQWGVSGFTYKSLEAAEKHFNLLK